MAASSTPKNKKRSPSARVAQDPFKVDPQLYSAAIEGAPDAFIVLDALGRIINWNHRAEEMFGWRSAEVEGKPLVEVIVAPAGAETCQQCLSALSEGDPRHTAERQRIPARRRDGDVFAAELQLTRACIDGRIHFTLLVRDISETAFAEQQLVQAQKLEAIGHLTGGLAHDFNNILGIIIGSLDLIAPAINDSDDRELVAAALSAAHRGADITRALLAVARRRALKPQATDVNLLIDELAPLLRQSAGKKIEVDISANALSPVCNIDPGGLNNALVNLVINARDAMPAGGKILIYAYTTDILPHALSAPLELKPGPYLVIGVDDTGSGMAPEVAIKAFDPFFTTKERGQGTGLGLAMVYGFARQSGGTARIESAPGRGTSVQLLIPVLNAGPSKKRRSGTGAATKAAATPRGHARILLVDDEPLLLKIASEWLGSLGHAVITAQDADTALKLLEERRYDLLLTDIIMPGALDGLALAERCRRLYPEMPTLLTTGYVEGLTAAMMTGCPVLEKPYTRSTLGQAVADAMQPATGIPGLN